MLSLGMLGWPTNASSDPGYVGFGAGGPSFLDHASIVMDLEDLVFTGVDGSSWDADLTYVLRNEGSETHVINVAFPYQLGTDYIYEMEYDEGIDDPSLTPFEMRVDGETVETQDDGSMHIAQVSWAPGQARTIQYRYTHRLDARFEYVTFYYWQRSGGTWAGPIGRVSVAIQLPDDIQAVTSSLPAQIDDERWLHIEMENWEPDRNIVVGYVHGTLSDWFDYFSVCRRALGANPAHQRSSAETLMALNRRPENGACQPLYWSSEYNSSPFEYVCPIEPQEQVPTEIQQCASELVTAADTDTTGSYLAPETLFDPPIDGTEPMAVLSYDEAFVREWIVQRVRNARNSQTELVRIPFWSWCDPVRGGGRVGTPDNVSGPFLSAVQGSPYVEGSDEDCGGDEAEVDEVDETAEVVVIEGFFTGYSNLYEEEARSLRAEFVILRNRSFRRESDGALTILLTPEEMQTPVTAFDDARSWLAITDSIRARNEDAQADAEARVAELLEAGFAGAEAFDSRRAPRLFCCYVTVVAGRFVTREEAAGAVNLLENAGFDGAYVRQGWESTSDAPP